MVDEFPQPPAKPVRQPVRTKVGGVALMVAGTAVPLYLLIRFNLFVRIIENFFTRADQISVFEGAFLIGFAYFCIQMGRHLCAPDAKEVMARDPRPPIVFLRPFAEDNRVIRSNPVGGRAGGQRADEKIERSDTERRLAQMFKPVGPFVTVGKPGESLAHLGAARLYVSHEEWMDTVQNLVHRAAAVVLQPEFSSGTLWEVQFVVKAVDLERLLLVVPRPQLRPLRYIRVRDLVQERFGITLPTVEECPPCDAFYFEDGKNPVPVRLDKEASSVFGLGVEHGSAQPFLDRLRALADSGSANV